jgi:hypothetical protein
MTVRWPQSIEPSPCTRRDQQAVKYVGPNQLLQRVRALEYCQIGQETCEHFESARKAVFAAVWFFMRRTQ